MQISQPEHPNQPDSVTDDWTASHRNTPTDHLRRFESAHFLQSLFANRSDLFPLAAEALGITITSRDGWIRLQGEEDPVSAAIRLLDDLEKSRRAGEEITPHSFRYSLRYHSDTMNPAQTDNAKENASPAGEPLNELVKTKLLAGGTKPPVTPRTSTQRAYIEALQSHDVSFGIGPAGTGKTYLAMAFALDLLKNREVDRILLTRPAVEAGEALGFLPGALEEKVLPYLRPLYDAMNDMLDGNEAVRFVEKNLIEIAPLAYMRGRTLNRACVILDEAQNASREQMFMFLTRLGEGSKCIVTGDPSQIDLRPKSRSGVLEAMNLLSNVEGISFTQFEAVDVVRHPVVARIIDAYEARSEGRVSQPED